MWAVIAIIVSWSLGISTVSACTDCIIVNNNTGHDNSSCLEETSTFYCRTLGYVLTNAASLNNTEIILFGDHSVSHTLTVFQVEGLTIRGGGKVTSVIKCTHSSHENNQGSGLLIIFSKRVRVINVIFESCGTLQFSTTVRNYRNIKYRSAVYIINSTDIQFIETGFHKSIGRGISMHDVDGNVEIRDSSFKENMVLPNDTLVFGGGSIYIEFTYCSPGYSICDPDSNTHNKNSRYLIEGCEFEGNRASNEEATEQTHIVQFRILPGSDGNNAGQGGGLHVIIKGSSFNNTVIVQNCTFYNNSALWGGGIDAIFLDRASNNTFQVKGCIFSNNRAQDRGGGALQLGFYGTEGIYLNSIVVENTKFVENSAGWGAAIAFFSSRSKSNLNTRLTVTNCVFESNSAPIGAAVHLRPEARQSIYEGSTPVAKFSNCSFTKNQVLYTGSFLNIANDEISQHVLESGTVDIESLEIDFSNYVSFTDNQGSAIVANSAQVNVLENTRLELVNNTATNGGAMALLGFSVLELHPGSHVLFESNRASELGGAVYATSPHQTEFIFSHKCFISFRGENFNDPDKWNTTLSFVNNSARYGYVIFTDSVLPCVKQIGAIYTNISAAFQWNSFQITPSIGEYTIATSPAAINFTLPQEISPGEMISVHPTSVDDLKQSIPIAFKVILDGAAETNPFIADDGHLKISGKPGTHFTLTLLTQNTRHVSATQRGRLGDCPLGFGLVNDSVCVCSASLPHREYVGVIGCDFVNFRALLQVGYWIGCSETKRVMTGVCFLNFCSYKTRSVLPVSRTCEGVNKETNICVENRRGQLCGECENGYSVYAHSAKLHCGKCPHGAVGILAYLASEIVPLFLLFVGIMAMKIKITSGFAQSFLLFAQTFFLINHAPSLRPLSDTSSVLLRIHTFIIGFFNLSFFYVDEMSFCLWRGATALDIVAFRYVSTFSTVLFLAIFLVVVNRTKTHKLQSSCFLLARFQGMIKKMKLFKNSIVHGISTFLILSYYHYTTTSFHILNQSSLNGEGGVKVRSVVFIQGSVDYFGPHHLPYSIPALLVLIFLSLPPPLLLISYPLLWKVKAKLRRNNAENENDKTLWPIRKLLPLIDSFQGVFRDNCRMFAGLLFLWRLILSAIFSLSTDLTELFLLTEIALLSILTIHALVRPYKRRLYNVVDGMMLANMALINLLKWYVSVPSTSDISSGVVELLVAIQLFLLYLPLICVGGYTVFRLLKRFRVIPDELKFSSAEEGASNAGNKGVKRKDTFKRRETCADEDLFSRAAELNTLPSKNVTCSEAGIETNNTTITTLGTD
jgi:predicted outer membrane repeat protein